MGNNLKAFNCFIERLKAYMATPPPRHLGQDLLKKPLSESDQDHSTFLVYDRKGIFTARILIESDSGEFWLNGLITRLELDKKNLQFTMYDWSGHSVWSISLEHLSELQIYQTLNGTILTVEGDRMIAKNRELMEENCQTERGSRENSPAAKLHNVRQPVGNDVIQLPFG